MTWMCRGETFDLLYRYLQHKIPALFLFGRLNCTWSQQSSVRNISLQSASLLPWALLLSSFLGSAFDKKLCLCISIPLLRFLIIESNMTVLNSYGWNKSSWGMPLGTDLFPAVHCHPLSLKIHPDFCPPCSLLSPHLLKLVMRMFSEIVLRAF